MKVKVKFFADLREVVGEEEKILEFENSPTIYEVLNLLVNICGKKFEERIFNKDEKLSENYTLLLNGKSIMLLTKDLNTLDITLKDGDEIAILPLVGGG